MPIGSSLGRLIAWIREFPRGSGWEFQSDTYWEERYRDGGSSGVGSYGKFAEFKAEFINDFVADNSVESVMEFGCGDGNQLLAARYPSYVGIDVSVAAIERCRSVFEGDRTKSFMLLNDYDGSTAELALSLDVIYHLVEDDVFERHMWFLFGAAEKYVIIYSSDFEDAAHRRDVHVRHRNLSGWIQRNISGWALSHHSPNRYPYSGDYRTGSFCDFFVYSRNSTS